MNRNIAPTAPASASRGGSWSVAQASALVFGVWWIVNGVGALLIDPNLATDRVHGSGGVLGVVTITVNGWHGLFHLLPGIAGVAVAWRPDASLVYALSVGALYIAAGVVGLIVGGNALGVIAVDSSGDVVHIAEGAIVFAAGLLTLTER